MGAQTARNDGPCREYEMLIQRIRYDTGHPLIAGKFPNIYQLAGRVNILTAGIPTDIMIPGM